MGLQYLLEAIPTKLNFMKIRILFLLSLSALFLNPSAFAAPIPGTTSSAMVAPKLGVYKSKFGFEILAQNTAWIQSQPPKKSRFIETVYQAPEVRNNTRASLSVRVDKLKKKTNLKGYVKRWVKEYPKYGYDVLGSKAFRTKDKKGYVIDLVNSKKKRQLRQVIYFKKQTAVLMTCRDHSRSFNQSLNECNNIIKAFHWN